MMMMNSQTLRPSPLMAKKKEDIIEDAEVDLRVYLLERPSRN
jgi:hypothetical protein